MIVKELSLGVVVTATELTPITIVKELSLGVVVTATEPTPGSIIVTST